MKHKDARSASWEPGEDGQDALWEALGKASPARPSGHFADDVVRAVRMLPERESAWMKFLKFTAFAGVSAGALAGVLILLNAPSGEAAKGYAVELTHQPPEEIQWQQIEAAAEVEMLVAAAERLDEFSDQELVHLIGL